MCSASIDSNWSSVLPSFVFTSSVYVVSASVADSKRWIRLINTLLSNIVPIAAVVETMKPVLLFVGGESVVDGSIVYSSSPSVSSGCKSSCFGCELIPGIDTVWLFFSVISVVSVVVLAGVSLLFPPRHPVIEVIPRAVMPSKFLRVTMVYCMLCVVSMLSCGITVWNTV